MVCSQITDRMSGSSLCACALVAQQADEILCNLSLIFSAVDGETSERISRKAVRLRRPIVQNRDKRRNAVEFSDLHLVACVQC